LNGVVPGSAAARAGLENGDVLIEPVPLYEVQNEPEAMLTLEIRRAGKVLEIEYQPRGEPMDGYQWFHRASVAGDDCESAT
jgi:hypothetical protein